MGCKERGVGIYRNIKRANMLKEDNQGFVRFPVRAPHIMAMDSGKTMVYIVAFSPEDSLGGKYCLSNLALRMPGTFVSDDTTKRPKQLAAEDIDSLLEQNQKEDEYDSMYFPSLSEGSPERLDSIPLTSAVCIGWSEHSYELRNQIGYWNAGFDDLTGEGKKLYYSLRKLHNNKEVRILTFNNV